MASKKKRNWKKYAFEFLSIFIAVITAFALNNWNDNRQLKLSEEKILTEIKNGISLDLQDFKGNRNGYRQSLRANKIFRDLISGASVPQDSMALYYTMLFRDFVPIINLSGYESLKASGLKTVRKDSLRFEIITLYDFYYSIIDKIEYEIDEMKSYENYFQGINTILHPYMEFDASGDLVAFKKPVSISDIEEKELLSYLWRLEINRKYKLQRYELIETKMLNLEAYLEKELKNR